MISYFRSFLKKVVFVPLIFLVTFGFSNIEFFAYLCSFVNKMRFVNNGIFHWEKGSQFLCLSWIPFVYSSKFQITWNIFFSFYLQNGTWKQISFRSLNNVDIMRKSYLAGSNIFYYRINKCIGKAEF